MFDLNSIPIIRERRITYTLKVTDDGQVLLKAPYSVSEKILRDFAAQHLDWIEKQLQAKAQFANDKFTPEEIANLFHLAVNYIPQRVAKWATVIGVSYTKLAIRNMVHNYGSCTSKGKLTFNCLLMLCPPEIIDSIVVHELCHRLQMNHSQKFYTEILRVMPDYYERHKWLHQHGDYYLRKLKASGIHQKQIIIK